MHAAEDDDVRTGPGRLLREPEGITDVIGDLLDFGDLIIVCENDGVELFFERENLLGQRFEPALGHGLADLQIVQDHLRTFGNINHMVKSYRHWRRASMEVDGWQCLDLVVAVLPHRRAPRQRRTHPFSN